MKTSELIRKVLDLGYRPSFSASEKNIIYVDTYSGLHVASINTAEPWWQNGEVEPADELISIFSEYANTPIEEREVQFTLQDAIDYLQDPIGKGHEIHEKAVKLTVKTLEYVREIIDNTYRCQDDVYALTDEDAMEELREYFKKHQPEKEWEEKE